ncbi:PLP-dependent cysteine synthase family protein [Kribbella sp. NPDC051587]|uniref:PLP-dependent cysteine synthase family protein n=1 Tax=Kribbella sp. NPDC051587 TaxID=3364119 RepID=UPI0037A12B6F
MNKILNSIMDTIGGTPMIRLDRLTDGLDGTIVAKLEYFSPSGSKKDRAAKRIIEDAEKSGELKPGQAVVEVTSGNTGAGLAIACAVTGHPFIAVLTDHPSKERGRMIRALGAEVASVDSVAAGSGEEPMLVEQEVRRIVASRGAFRANQFGNRSDVDSHYTTTGREMWEQAGDDIDAFVDFVGTGGCLAGVTRALKEQKPSIKCYAVEPEGVATLAGMPVSRRSHGIQGGGLGRHDLTHLHHVALDGYLQVSGEDARTTCRELARREGVFAGYSAGANVAAALQLLRGRFAGGTVALVIPDTGMKYLSTDLWA